MLASSFRSISSSNSKVLVLGSLPGQESLRRGEYYAHPRTGRDEQIIDALSGEYRERTHRLMNAGIALWDVCAAAHRPGSLDSAIQGTSVNPNDFATFFSAHPHITLIAFNGAKAAELYRKHVGLTMPRSIVLPSTSPANAGIPYSEKLERWSEIKRVCET